MASKTAPCAAVVQGAHPKEGVLSWTSIHHGCTNFRGDPCICVHGVAPDKPLDSVALTRLKQFSPMNKLKKMALRVIAENLSEDEIAGLREMFKMLDTDNSGQIKLEELKSGLKRVGFSKIPMPYELKETPA